MNKMNQLAQLGQAVWIDTIRRSILQDGSLQAWIDQGLRGMTSNPTIFEKAIADSQDYDSDLETFAARGQNAEQIFVSLAVDDIAQAADLFRPVYESSRGQDGYVSLEVSPTLAQDSQGTLEEVRLLWQRINRPNVMIKIPATPAGLPAITAATAEGINVNVTLIFSLQRYADVMAAYLQGLEQRALAGLSLESIHSVASFFVSRVDTKVDAQLKKIIETGSDQATLARQLLGRAAIANARMAYSQFKAVFEGDVFARLKVKGANLQRPLWASTSTKNPQYSNILYVQELIAPHTVNTMPEETIRAFLDHGEPRPTLEEHLEEAQFVLQSLASLGISMETVTTELEAEGVASFGKSYQALLDSIETKRATVQPTPTTPLLQFSLGAFESAYQAALASVEKERILARIWDRDYTVWNSDPKEISNRLGWLDSVETMRPQLPRIQSFMESIVKEGYQQAVLLGMGGSSLAPELFAKTFNPAPLNLQVLDSTHPAAVLRLMESLDPRHTLFIVSTKSGTTEETLSFFKTFYNWTLGAVGADQAGEHFIAITDPGSKLASLAQTYRFRDVFLNDPNIGGRYSALSFFGLLPAALAGVDLSRLLESAAVMARRCASQVAVVQNPAALLGVALGELANAGHDKVTFVLAPEILSFGDWVEQLIAESTGKIGKGILPVVREPLQAPASYGKDRVFVEIRLAGQSAQDRALAALKAAEFPFISLTLTDIYDLGGQFLLWELATAVASERLKIHPFDQPNVESAKVGAREMVAAYKSSGSLPAETPVLSRGGTAVYGDFPINGIHPNSPEEALAAFLSQAQAGDYVSLQAFIEPDEGTAAALASLREKILERYSLATTSGYGPRFLHSTGQLHKGDAGKGLFIQFTNDPIQDLPIPDEAGSPASSMNFSVLVLAQAMGDRQALLDAHRRVVRFHFVSDAAAGIQQLANSL